MPGPVAQYVKRTRQFAAPPAAAVARLREKVLALESRARLNGGSLFLPWLDKTNVHRASPATLEVVFAAMRNHYVVKPALLQKLFSVSSLDLQATPADETPRDEEVAEFTRYQFAELLTVRDLVLETLFPAMVLGRVVCELVWHEDLWPRGRWKGRRFFRAVKAKSRARPVYDDFRELVAVEGPGADGKQHRWEPEGFLVLRNLPWFGDDGTSDFLAIYQPLWELETIKTLEQIHLDKFTSPFLWATYGNAVAGVAAPTKVIETDPATGAEAEVAIEEVLDAQLAAIKSRGYGFAPAGVELQALQLAVRGEAEFRAAVQDREQKVVLGIAGAFLQQLTSQGGSGDLRGDSQTQASTAQLFVWDAAAAFCAALNRQAVPALVRENYGEGVDYPTLTLGGVNLQEQNALADLYVKAAGAGVKPSRRAFAKATGVQLATEPGDELLPPGGAAPPGPPLFRFGEADRIERRLERQAANPGGDVALGGADGAKAEQLLSAAREEGAAALARLARAAVERSLQKGPASLLKARKLWGGEEVAELAGELAKVHATGELLGRSRILKRAEQVEAFREGGGARRFSEVPTDLRVFDEGGPLVPMAPLEALDYFRKLVPTLGVNPERFGRLMERQAFTAAAATDTVVLARIQEVVRRRLEGGEGVGGGAAEIDAILDEAGVGPRRRGYSEMLVRTNLMDAYNAGASRQLEESADLFPVWRYSNPVDNRSRPHHAARNGKYYSSGVPFVEVRGTGIEDAANDRCTFIPIDRFEWEELEAAGARVER